MNLTKEQKNLVEHQVNLYLKQLNYLRTKELRIKLMEILSCSNYKRKKQFCKMVLQNSLSEAVVEAEDTINFILSLIKNKLIFTYDYLVQMTLIGDSVTGKDALLKRYMEGTFEEKDPSTVSGSDFKTFVYENALEEIIKVRVWVLVYSPIDKMQYNKISEAYFVMPTINLVTFSCSDKDSFIAANYTLEKLQELSPYNIKLLVGTKSDLTQAKVTEEEAQQLAHKHGVIYYSTSAKNGANVKELFDNAIYMAIERTKKLNQRSGTKAQSEPSKSTWKTSLFNFFGVFFPCDPRKQVIAENSFSFDYKKHHGTNLSKL